MKFKKKISLLLEKETIKAFGIIFAFVSNVKFSEPNSKSFTSCSSEKYLFLKTTTAHWVNGIPKTMSEFMLI